ncbi:MAG: FG-GAP-like repeat-containing protein [Candidatus Hydrogenedentes bacterium]|nr:FG-GAP-like repeat-containing protein [Candidatus Hydrogenedentota bacterium]
MPVLYADDFVSFKEHVINPDAEVVYAVDVTDMNKDGKPDIIGISATYVAWYENPTWKQHRIAEQFRKDNVCVAIHDIDGDGVPELAVGADWQPNNTEGGGAIYLLKHMGDPAAPWAVTTIRETVPTLHRMRWADVDGNGAHELIVSPLKGVGSTPPNFDDKPLRIFALRPGDGEWTEELINESLHVCHNIWPWRVEGAKQDAILAASFEGITLLRRINGSWSKDSLAPGNYEPIPRAGAGEIKVTAGKPYMLATIEPWHANHVVVYKMGSTPADWKREVLDDSFAGGHAIYWADFDGDGDEDLLAGHRDKSPAKQKPGLFVYENTGDGWEKHSIDEGGMATEDAVAADLNGDGRADIVAGGRSTHNIKLYENVK